MGYEHATPLTAIFLLFVSVTLWWAMRRAAHSAHSIHVRRIAGIDALDEAVGRAAEMGRPISFTTGLTELGPTLYACLGVLDSVARKAAQYRTKLLLPQSAPDVMALMEERVRAAYSSVGRAAAFEPQNLVFLSGDQFAYSSGYIGLLHRERVASTFLFGSFSAESLLLSDAGQQVGAMQVAASADPEQVAFFVVTCDYTLIGEELFAASGYLSREPRLLASLVTQDLVKFILMMMIVVGVILNTVAQFYPEVTGAFKVLAVWRW